MRQGKLFKSVRAAISLDETAMFNVVLTDNGFRKWILDLNRSQLFQGEDSEGKSLGDIGGGYSFTTEFLNEGVRFTFKPSDSEFGDVEGGSKGKVQGQDPFLLDTGDYYSSYTLKVGNGLFKIESDPFKDGENLEDSFGNNLEGLQDKNLQKVINAIRKTFSKEVRSLITAKAV